MEDSKWISVKKKLPKIKSVTFNTTTMITDKQPQEVGVWVKASERLPESWHLIPTRYIHTRMPILNPESYNQSYDLIEWLSPQQAVVLSAEEWERVKKTVSMAIEEIEDMATPLRIDWRKSKAWKSLQQLNRQQLNQQP